MRIISGIARGRQLATFPGQDIRPTPDRVREALFSLLTSRFGSLSQLKVLELFAGSGAQALEAISRGAQSAILVDSGKIAAATICENIKRCHFEQMTEFIRQDVYRALPGLVDSGPFDLILLDPPYRENHIPQVIEKIESLNLLAKNGILCAESAKNEEFNDLGSMTLLRSKVYGTTRIHLYGQLKD